MSKNYTDNVTLLNAITATATSEWSETSKRDAVSVQFTAASITSGNGVFTVQVSNDGSNWYPYRRLIDPSTTTANLYYGSVTLSANTTQVMLFPSGDYFRMVRARCVVTTDGSYTATLQTAG